MRRREFLGVLGSAAAMPLAARAQQPAGARRLGVLTDTAESNPEGQARIAALRQGLRELGWTEDRNIRIDYRWASGDIERAHAHAVEIVALKPDVIFALANAQLASLSRETRTIPIVFVGASDPVGAGYVASFARPGGNITGFTLYEPTMAGKWLGVLKETAPAVVRVAIMVNPDTGMLRGTFYINAFETAATTFAVEAITANVRSVSDIEAAIVALAHKPDSGLIIASDSFTQAHDELIVTLAARHRMPAVYGNRSFPAELPVQAPTKFEMVINLKTAKALGLTVPPSLIAGADEVIE